MAGVRTTQEQLSGCGCRAYREVFTACLELSYPAHALSNLQARMKLLKTQHQNQHEPGLTLALFEWQTKATTVQTY